MKKNVFFIVLLFVSPLALSGSKGNPTVWPDWDLGIVGGIQERAYPGINYETRIGVDGGQYPYGFTKIDGPDNLFVDRTSGIISWSEPAAGTHSVSIRIVDSSSNQINYDYTLQVSKSGFQFVSPLGSDMNDGSIDSPWRSISYALSNALADDIVYLRGGEYSVNNMVINDNNASNWMAYPFESPRLNLVGTDIKLTSGSGDFAQFSGLEIYNCGDYCFKVDTGRNITYYKNKFHDLNSTCYQCNPSFLLFGGHNITSARHENVKVMNNSFSNLNSNNASETDGATVVFDVHNSLFEDNQLRAMRNFGFADKDNTYRNTYRGNYIEGAASAIGLKAQYGSKDIHVHHNLMIAESLLICQIGPCSNFYIHHNTLVDGFIDFRDGVNKSESGNINFAYNIFTSISASAAFWSTAPATFAGVFTGTKLNANHNIIEADTSRIAGNYWGGARYISQNEWTSSGHDTASLFTSPSLQNSGIATGLSPSSQYYGIYGHQLTEGGPSALPSTPAGFTAIIKRD